MGLEQAIDITASQRKTVLTLLQRHLPRTEAWVYGSRAKWTARPQSDLDLVVFATPDQRNRIGALRDAFEESNLPFRVDLFVWDEVPEEFREEIESEHIVLAVPSKLRRPREADGWVESTLGDVADFVSGGTPTKSNADYWKGSTPWVSAKDMKRFRIYDTEDHVTNAGVDNGTKLVPEGTVLLLVRGMRLVNEVPICVVQRAMTFNQDIKALHPKSNVTSQYLPYLLLGNKQRLHSLVDLAGHGTGRLNSDELKALDVVLPAPTEQCAIASVLGTLDDKIELNRRMNETLEAITRAIFKDWFVDFGPVHAKMEGREPYLPPDLWDLFPDAIDDEGKPVGWKFDTLARLAAVNRRSWTTRRHPPYVEYVDLSNAKWGNVDALVSLAWKDAPSRARRIAKVGDTIVGTTRPANGSYAYISRNDLTVSTGFAVLSPHTAKYRDAVYLAATSRDNIERLANLADAHGGAYPAVKPSVVLETPMMFPGDKILASFAEHVSPARERIELTKAESQTLAHIRDLLLPKLISGEIHLRAAEKFAEVNADSPSDHRTFS